MFDSFRELYENMDLLKCGYDKSNVSSVSYIDMEKYYSADDIKKVRCCWDRNKTSIIIWRF